MNQARVVTISEAQRTLISFVVFSPFQYSVLQRTYRDPGDSLNFKERTSQKTGVIELRSTGQP